jgi:hypothetical protein
MALARRKFISVIMICAILTNCKNEVQKMKSPVEVAFSLEDVSSSVFHVNDEDEVSTFFDTSKTVTTFETIFDLSFSLLDAVGDNYRLSTLIHSPDFLNSAQDSTISSIEKKPLQNLLKAFSGASFETILTREGKVIEFKGLEPVMKVAEGINRQNNINDQSWKTSTLFRAEYYESIISMIFNTLPNHPISIGLTWTKNELDGLPSSSYIKCRYKCDSINGKVMGISCQSPIISKLLYQNSTMPLVGGINGEFILNQVTGSLVAGKKITNLEGSIKINNSNFLMKIRRSLEISSTKNR